MTVTGLNLNGYCINNPIYVWIRPGVFHAHPISQYSIKITNNRSQASHTFLFSAVNKEVHVNISPMLKALFKKPKHKYATNTVIAENYIENAARETFSFRFGMYLFSGQLPIATQEINYKQFFRAGFFNNTFDTVLPMGKILHNYDKIPYWEGFPVEEYYIGESYNIYFRPLGAIPAVRKEKMPNHLCNPVYIKFLNALGGYSYWLFEGQTIHYKTQNAGYYNADQRYTTDYGNTLETTLELYSKVPQRYINSIRELIVSPEIYAYQPENRWKWTQIINNNNTFAYIEDKKINEVQLSFLQPINYNPQTLFN